MDITLDRIRRNDSEAQTRGEVSNQPQRRGEIHPLKFPAAGGRVWVLAGHDPELRVEQT